MQPPSSSPMWQGAPLVPPPMMPSPEPPGPTWAVLRIVSVLIKIAAFLELIAGIGYSVYYAIAGLNGQHRLSGEATPSDILIGLLASLISIIIFLFIYAVADLIMVLVHIEKNTRHRA